MPGAVLGLGCHLASPKRSMIRGVIAGIAGLFLGLATDWWFFQNGTFLEYLSRVTQIDRPTQLLVAIGTLMAFWWGKDASPWASRILIEKPVHVKGGIDRENP